MRFTWHSRKAAANLRKHGISFLEAREVFSDVLAITIPDPDHSIGEHRFVTVGVSSSQRLLVVSYTVDDEEVVRIINARKPTAHERKQYEDPESQ